MKVIIILLLLVTGILPSLALAQQIYKWKDEKGVIHYGQTLPPGATAIDQTITEKNRIGGSFQAPEPEPPENNLADKLNEQFEKQKQRDATVQKKNCAEYKRQLSHLNSQARVYKTNEDGKQVFLNPEQRDKERRAFQERINSDC